MSQFYISATHKSSGKTMVSIGLCVAFCLQNYRVQCFKKGPDYIDNIWLSVASGQDCFNLDFYTMYAQEIKNTYHHFADHSDISLVEGNKGLYDGLSVMGGDCNADLAKLLDLSVILVVDASGITRGIAPLLNGYRAFDSVDIKGIILNKVATSRHEKKLTQAVEYYTDFEIFGAIRRREDLLIKERYLGLKPAYESKTAKNIMQNLATFVREQVDIKRLLEKTSTRKKNLKPKTTAKLTPAKEIKLTQEVLSAPDSSVTLAVAKDCAFGFYYPDDLRTFLELNVNIKYFDTLKDTHLPDANALFIGGGFPEIYARELSANASLMKDIRAKIMRGMPGYVECGGLMYLSRSIITNSATFKMAGIIAADTQVFTKPIGRGYVKLVARKNHLWQMPTHTICAHEFHYSKLINIAADSLYAYQMLRGVGIDKERDGIMVNNLLGCYSHFRTSEQNPWVERFVIFIKHVLQQNSLVE